MLTVGVDLAAEPRNTAVARIRWTQTSADVLAVGVGADDPVLVEEITAAEKAGIDCPLGWPRRFVEFDAQHQAGAFVAPADVAGRHWRRQLALRETDLVVRSATGLNPLSVAADRIGLAAMRCASLLARLAAAGQPVHRSGAGVVAEVHPAAAPWLNLGDHEQARRRSDHVLDAVIAALNARPPHSDNDHPGRRTTRCSPHRRMDRAAHRQPRRPRPEPRRPRPNITMTPTDASSYRRCSGSAKMWPVGWEALRQWGDDVARIEPLAGGVANDVWSVSVNGHLAVGRLGARSDADLGWETELLRYLDHEGLTVPVPIPTADGRLFADGLVVTTYVEGGPPETEADWRRVAGTLRQLHRLTQGWPQRPGWRSSTGLLHADTGTKIDLGAMPPEGVARCRAAWARLIGRQTCVVHGDANNPGNVRMTANRVALIGWDESHVDVPDLDLVLPHNAAGLDDGAHDIAAQASAAWEAAVCWDDQNAVKRACRSPSGLNSGAQTSQDHACERPHHQRHDRALQPAARVPPAARIALGG